MKSLFEIVKNWVKFDGIYCDDWCEYKYFDDCRLFNEKTKYNYTKDLTKRIGKCIKYFGKTKKKVRDENYCDDGWNGEL